MMYYLIKCILFSLVALTFTQNCRTPNDEGGECISLHSCPTLLNKLASKQDTEVEFVRKSSCGYNGSDPLVCCITPLYIAREKHAIDPNKEKLLPPKTLCGYQHADDYIREDTNVAAISEFPWLALPLYNKGNGSIHISCAGSLINERYVLTTAHCITPELVGVRLGEYNINNDTDCTTNANVPECSDPPENIGIETKIIYPDYNEEKHIHDIGLIRLNKTIQFSDYIRPICLPFSETISAKPGDTVSSSGMGLSSIGGGAAIIKKKVLKKIITHDLCVSSHPALRQFLNDDQFCTIDISNSTDISCIGDSGAPVAFSNRNHWHQEGIVSYGVSCGTGLPEIHVKVANYLDWIINSLEPYY